ncbi:MAG: response regulator, partial [Campylobacter sp.]|nr:response regulator [Campylobacter sp.]
MRILIVEDEVTLNKTIAEGLGEFGYQTDNSESFKDAEYYIGIRNYDLVLTDWMLPDGSGLELINLIKQKSPRTSV